MRIGKYSKKYYEGQVFDEYNGRKINDEYKY